MNYQEITEFLKSNTPILLDMVNQDLKYDTRSIYFKTYKYIYDLREENKRLNGEITRKEILQGVDTK